jgi:hypothetical protein
MKLRKDHKKKIKQTQKKTYSKHVHKSYNRRDNDLLGFEEESDYRDFCRYLVELYEDNEQLTITSLCEIVQEKHEIKLYYERCRRILHQYGAKVRPKLVKKRRTKGFRFVVDIDDYDFIQSVEDTFDSRHMKREYTRFALHVLRGKSSPHLLLWLSEFKPVVFLYDAKKLTYTVVGDDISKLESNVIEDLLIQVEHDGDLRAVKTFADSKGLTYWGGHNE